MPFSQAFTSMAIPSVLSTLTNFCFSHMASLGQPDLIKDSQTVYMHQITLHALCSGASGVALQFPFLLLFAHFLPPFFPRHHDFKTFSFFAPYPLLTISHLTTALSSPHFPSLFSLHVFAPSLHAILLPVTLKPHPSNFPPTFLSSYS